MISRLFRSKRLWTIWFLWLVVCSLDEVEATLDDVGGSPPLLTAASFGISLLDVWAGISSFSDGFAAQAHVPVQQRAWIENAPAAIALLAATYSAANNCCDFYNYSWTGWKFNWDLVVTAGPSCCPFSVSGKRLRQHDPRSTQGLDTAALAVHLGAKVLIVENVSMFINEDYRHNLVSEMVEYLQQHGLILVATWVLLDSALGGCSGRERVFLVWEEIQLASSLPAWPPPPKLTSPTELSSCLEPPSKVKHLAVGVQCKFVRDETVEDIANGDLQAFRVGSVWLRGLENQWMKGEAIKFPGDNRVWRILEITHLKLRLIFDSRSQPKFIWICKSEVDFSLRHWLEWPVYSIHGVARAIRHTAFAPGDLYLDDRDGKAMVRPLSPQEKWRVMGLSVLKANKLQELGLSDEKSQLAGNSICANMSNAVAEVVGKRMASYQKLKAAKVESSFVNMVPKVGLYSASLSATFLVVLCLSSQSVISWGDGAIPGMVHEVDQDAAFTAACNWADSLGFPDASDKCVLLEQSMGNSKARAVIYYGMQVAAVDGAVSTKIDSILDTELGELAVAALAQVQRMKGAVWVNPAAKSGWESGRVEGTAAFQEDLLEPAAAEDELEFLDVVKQHDQESVKLSNLLQVDGSSNMLEWDQRLTPLCVDEVPVSLRKPLPKLEWSQLLIPDPHLPVHTDWQPLPEKVELPTRPAPQGWLSSVKPPFRMEAARRVRAFSKKMTIWLTGASEKPKTVVIPGSWLEHWVFEAPHDFQSQPGFAVPLDLSTPSSSHLNLDFYEAMGLKYPDQELMSFLVLGTTYKADIPVQIVLQPHLKSFLPVQEKYLKESDRFIDRGWTVCCTSIPLVPFFCASCGSVCRPLEPDRPRCTNDAGAPRTELWDEDGLRVIPLNESISESWWPKEVKPSTLDVMIVIRVLQEAAQSLGSTLFCICDDYKSFFNQLRLRPGCYPQTGAIHPPRPGQESVSFAYDKVLGFGIKMASNIAQRFADFLVHIFKQQMAPVVEAAAKKLSKQSSTFAKWWDDRLKLGSWQAVLVVMLMYCDDPIIICVGADMTYEALKVWTWMSKQGNTMMAIPEKRSLGLSAKWIGVKFFVSLGLGVVTAQKVLRAFSSIDLATSGSLTADEYRSLIGFLEHVRAVLFLRGDKMYGLYAPLNWGLCPIERVECSYLMELQLNRFKHRLTVQAGSSVANVAAFISGKPMPKVDHGVTSRRWAIFSDAAKEGTDKPGLGAWICGYVWRVPLSDEHLILHISLLEGIAAVVNIVCVHRLMGGTDHLPSDTCIEAHVDAQATAQILIRGRARSPAMVFLHSLALEIPEFVAMLPFLRIMHVFGLGNIASDAASRGYDNVLNVVAHSVGVKLLHLPEPELAYELLDKCLQWRSKQMHEHCWGDDAILFGEADHPGPTYAPIKREREQEVEQAAPIKRVATNSTRKVTFNPVNRLPGDSCKIDTVQLSAVIPASSYAAVVPMQRPAVNDMSVQNLAKMLQSDTSDYAICRGKPDQLLVACRVALETAANAFAVRTAKQDAAHWDVWSKYCHIMNTDPMRPPVDPQTDRVGYLREVVLLVNALVHFMKTRKPRSKVDSVIKPQSAMNILLGANRVLKLHYLSFIPLRALKLPLRGLMRQFLKDFGPLSLIPKRREPMTNGMVRSLSALPPGFSLGPLGPHDPNSIVGKSWRAAVATLASSGFRKAEAFESNSETHFLSWPLVNWFISGKGEAEPTDSLLQGMKLGDFAVITPPPSKSDQFNTVWGALPVYLPFKEEARNAAQALQQLALAVGAPFRDNAQNKAVFVHNCKRPLKCTEMASALYAAMTTITGSPISAKLYTWHSFRSYLATALHAASVKPSTIQAMLRWQTDESLRAYSRLSRHEAAKFLDAAANAVIASVQTANVPMYEEFQLFLAMNQVVENMA